MKIRNQIYIIGLVFFLISAAFVFFVYWFFQDIKMSSNQIKETNVKFGSLGIEKVKIDEFAKDYSNYEHNFQKIDQMFIDKDNPVNLIEFMEKSASALNLKLDSGFLPSNPNRPNNSAQFQVNLSGGFPSVIKFMQALENGPYLISIDNLTLKKVQKPNNIVSKDIEADFLINVLVKN